MKLVRKGRLGGFLPGHQPDRFVLRDRLGVGDRHESAVSQYGHAIAEADDFIPAVRDEEDDSARVTQASDELGEPRDLAVAEGGSRFVEQEDARITLDGAHDLQHLLLAKREIADARARIDVEAMASENLLRRLAGALSGDAAPRVGRRGGEQKIALDAQLTHQGQFLKHAGNALADGVIRVAQSDQLAVEGDASLIGKNCAADNLDQGRFARAVLTRQAEDSSACRLQTDRFQRTGCAEGLFDPRQRQHGMTRPDFAILHDPGAAHEAKLPWRTANRDFPGRTTGRPFSSALKVARYFFMPS